MAVYCCVPAATIDAVAGVTAMEVSVGAGALTVRVALPEMLPDVAVMVDVPAAMAVANPATEMVAAPVVLLDQVTVEVQLEVVLFE